jgi:hypothetical protein
MRILWAFLFAALTGCAGHVAPTNMPSKPVIRITEIGPDKWTGLTRQNLDHLFQVYDLGPLTLTYNIQIESQVAPHSHPVLTLNTLYAEKPNRLLAAFLHEQLHWWVETKKIEMAKAIEDLKRLYPFLPKDPSITYAHLVIGHLEYEALIFYLKRKEANKVLKEIIYKDKITPWIYKEAYLKFKEIHDIVLRNNLSPLPQNPTKKP